MNISELRPRQGSVSIEAQVKVMEEARTFNKFGKDLRVANAIIEDESGSIKFSLWNDDIEKVHVGDTIRVTNGFVNEFKGENQLTTGKFGKLEVIKHGAESRADAKQPSDKDMKEKPAKEEQEDETDDLGDDDDPEEDY